MKCSLKSLLVLLTWCGLVTAGGLFVIRSYQRQAGISQFDVSSHEANQFLPPDLHVPESATNVSYYVDFGASEVEFAIAEDRFLAWCKTRRWSVGRIEQPTVYFDSSHLPVDLHYVDVGYEFAIPGGHGVYDAGIQRAGFCVSTFP